MADLNEYHRIQRWLRGKRPQGQGRIYRKGERKKRPHPRIHLLLVPMDGMLADADNTEMPYTIRQLVPAKGWRTRYSDTDGSTFVEPLAFLALADCRHEDKTIPAILGIDYSDEEGWKIASQHDNFVCLVPPWDDDDEE